MRLPRHPSQAQQRCSRRPTASSSICPFPSHSPPLKHTGGVRPQGLCTGGACCTPYAPYSRKPSGPPYPKSPPLPARPPTKKLRTPSGFHPWTYVPSAYPLVLPPPSSPPHDPHSVRWSALEEGLAFRRHEEHSDTRLPARSPAGRLTEG